MYFEDFTAGYSFLTESHTVSKDEIVNFATQWDPQPFHIDEIQANDYPYGGLIASGWHTLLISFRLVLETGIFEKASIGSPGMQELRWLLPVKPGDKLLTKAIVQSAKRSKSDPARGFINVNYAVINQREENVATYAITHMLRVGPK